MDDPKPVILDISSDEEIGFFSGRGGRGGCRDEFKFFSELFGEVEDNGDGSYRNNESGESDDVVVVGEVFVNRRQRRSKSSNNVSKSGGGGGGDDDDDEDCVVLECDPDKLVPVENKKEEDDNNCDDLVLVSEKGEVACRDFPHPRHLCAKFPFASTLHEKHCDQCHCYVCDSPAPCANWMTGILNVSIDHCHATDKDKFWEAERNSMRGHKAPPVVPAATNSAIPLRPPLLIQPRPLSSNMILQNQVSRHPTIRPCSVPTSNVTADIGRQSRSHHPVCVVPRIKFQHNLLSQHSRSTSNRVRERRHCGSNLGPQLSSPRMNFKRTQPVGATLTTDRNRCKFSNQTCGFSKYPSSTARWQGPRGGVMPVSDVYVYQKPFLPNVGQVTNSMSSQTKFATQRIVGDGFANHMPHHPQMSPKIPSQQNVSGGYLSYVPPLPQMSSQRYSSNECADYVPQTSSQQQCVFADSVASQPLVDSEQHLSGHFGNPLPSQSQVDSQLFVTGSFDNLLSTQPHLSFVSQQNGQRASECSEASQPQSSWQFDAGDAFEFQGSSQSTRPSSPSNVEITLETPPLEHQPENYGQPTLTLNKSDTRLQQVYQTQDASGSNSAVSNFSWLSCTSPSSQQLPIDNSQVQSAEPTDNPLVTVELSSQFTGSADFAPSELQYNNWFFENDSFSEALGLSVLPAFNDSYPEHAPVYVPVDTPEHAPVDAPVSTGLLSNF